MIEVPLSELAVAPSNSRKAGADDVGDLVASIRAHGLLQNLTVVGALRGAKYHVIAGGRRLRALKQLAEEQAIAADWPVPCRLIDNDAAAEASLTENVSREAMHPADEFAAFAQLIEDGASVGEVAARFGKSERYVQQRMGLANVSPTILAEYRAGEASLEQMMALAITDDQARQLRVWKAARGAWERQPDRLRGAITDGEFSLDSQLGKFVSVKSYESAGGAVRRDLFGEEKDSYLIDTELVTKLAQEKLERTAEKIRKEGWAWVEARIEFNYSDQAKFGRAPSTWKGSKESWSDAAKKHAGAVVSVGYNGHTEIERGLVRPEDRKTVQKSTGSAVTGGKKAAGERKPGDLSFASIQRLQAEAGQIIAANVSSNPDVAIALLTAELADKVFYNGWDGPRTWVHIRREQTGRAPAIVKDVKKGAAAIDLEAQEKAWRGLLPKKRNEARAWILAVDAETVRKLLAFLVARETEVVDVSPNSKHGVVELASSAGVDLAAHWKPTAEWLATLPKSTVIAMAKEAGAKDVDLAKLAKQPKATLAAEALPFFPAGWLPKPLRQAKAAKKPAKKAKRAA